MNYVSTRGKDEGELSSAYAIKTGLASDGGLYMPERIPEITSEELAALIKKSYPERAAFILSKFLTDYSYDELLADAKGAYSEEKLYVLNISSNQALSPRETTFFISL